MNYYGYLTLLLLAFGYVGQTQASSISAHNDNYFLPIYRESNVNEARFGPLNPNDHSAKNAFIQFQISLKYKLLGVSRTHDNGLYFAYTQRSNWEAYDKSPYFRDSQYTPEILYQIQLSSLRMRAGLKHESNGAGGLEEDSWNRIYIDLKWRRGNSFVRFQPWTRIGPIKYSPDIADFLGYGEIELGWIPKDSQKLRLRVANFFTKNWGKGSYHLSWAFPIAENLQGYVKVETGYGLTISNYNFKETGLGVGFSFGL